MMAVAVSCLVFISCGKSGADPNADKMQPVTVKIEILKPARLVDGIQVAGIVKASEDVNLTPEEGGVVKMESKERRDCQER